jgi:hypothetical protein
MEYRFKRNLIIFGLTSFLLVLTLIPNIYAIIACSLIIGCGIFGLPQFLANATVKSEIVVVNPGKIRTLGHIIFNLGILLFFVVYLIEIKVIEINYINKIYWSNRMIFIFSAMILVFFGLSIYVKCRLRKSGGGRKLSCGLSDFFYDYYSYYVYIVTACFLSVFILSPISLVGYLVTGGINENFFKYENIVKLLLLIVLSIINILLLIRIKSIEKGQVFNFESLNNTLKFPDTKYSIHVKYVISNFNSLRFFLKEGQKFKVVVNESPANTEDEESVILVHPINEQLIITKIDDKTLAEKLRNMEFELHNELISIESSVGTIEIALWLQ